MAGNASRDVRQRLMRALALAAAAGAFLAAMGAMGTGGMPLERRFLFWVTLMMAVAPLGVVAGLLSDRLPQSTSQVGRWAIVTVGLTLPLTLLTWVYTATFLGYRLNAVQLPVFFGATLCITAVMAGVTLLIERPGAVTHASPLPLTAGVSEPAPAPRARFLDRLPDKLKGAALSAIKAEDHYLRLYTSKGEDLILMRLGDAIGELDGIEGAQTHRSWWVAKDAVERVERGEGKATLILIGGIEAPVSRANLKPLRDAGWL